MEAGKDPVQVGEDFRNGEISDQELLEYLYKTEFTEESVGPVAASATNYILLAHILEQVTGQSYEDYMKENIFDAHRRHLYQLFANEYKIDHRLVSFVYALAQAIICILVIKKSEVL